MNIDVSIVIVCMNNLKNLYPCLESIKKYTTVSYETLVVAYLFSKDNLEKVKNDFPWVTFIESNEIRGFSENNNLALRLAKGKYCFVLNDDTEMKMDVVGGLVRTIENLPKEVAIVSPRTIYKDGNVQTCGRPFKDWKKMILQDLHLINDKSDKKYSHKKGVFKTFNIIGAAFLIKTDIFNSVGFFDERYFFTPEDIALSTLLNKLGYSCYVNADIDIVHYESMSGKPNKISYIQAATIPAAKKGILIMFSQNNKMIYLTFGLWIIAFSLFQYLFHSSKSFTKEKPNFDDVLAKGAIRTCITLFSSLTPKDIFKKYYLNY